MAKVDNRYAGLVFITVLFGKYGKSLAIKKGNAFVMTHYPFIL